MEHVNKILNYKIINLEKFQFSISQAITLISILIITRLLIWIIKNVLDNKKEIKKLNRGGRHALFQIIQYIAWIISITLCLEVIGIKITFLLAGSAALLVGIGLGLQQTFNDIVSGIILLLEGSIRIDDIIEVDDKVVKVKSIGLRTSEVVDRNDIIVILPNSRIVTDKVINWSHNIEETRFKISVGVAYGTNVDLVIKLLEESALEHPKCVSATNKPVAHFKDFGDSSLVFDLLFWSDDLFRIEGILSDIRRTIDRKFRENNIHIPFPQRDLHIISSKVPFSTQP